MSIKFPLTSDLQQRWADVCGLCDLHLLHGAVVRDGKRTIVHHSIAEPAFGAYRDSADAGNILA